MINFFFSENVSLCMKKGEILTTNYLNFSEPKALKKLNELSNITLKMYDVDRRGVIPFIVINATLI